MTGISDHSLSAVFEPEKPAGGKIPPGARDFCQTSAVFEPEKPAGGKIPPGTHDFSYVYPGGAQVASLGRALDTSSLPQHGLTVTPPQCPAATPQG